MTIGDRTSYALRFLVVFTAILMLVLSIAEGAGARFGFSIGALVTHPAYLVPCFVLAWFAAPFISRRLPAEGNFVASERGTQTLPRWVVYAITVGALLVSGYSLFGGSL